MRSVEEKKKIKVGWQNNIQWEDWSEVLRFACALRKCSASSGRYGALTHARRKCYREEEDERNQEESTVYHAFEMAVALESYRASAIVRSKHRFTNTFHCNEHYENSSVYVHEQEKKKRLDIK